MLVVLFFAALTATRPALAQTETVLYNFCSLADCADGADPQANLIQDSSGKFYGITYFGGANSKGSVYKLSPEGVETVLHSFGATSTDGTYPQAGLVMDKSGNLYGTTYNGGEYGYSRFSYGYGTIFKISTDGTETILYNFGATKASGTVPIAGLVMDSKGNLYGTNAGGGKYGQGTIFKLTPTGTETALYNFGATANDGINPSTLLMDKSGNFYGTCGRGGQYGNGIVFELTASRSYSILHEFGSIANDGANPDSAVVMDSAGNLYGVTENGGAHWGTVYELSPGMGGAWTETILHNFEGAAKNDGSNPAGVPALDKQGNLYGTTYWGGNPGFGTVYKVTAAGDETVLFNFNGNPSGTNPWGGLLLNSKGNLYGTATTGGVGTYGASGVVYEVTP
jgi:uncharacterized repeat protein (TIGR03803 family)